MKAFSSLLALMILTGLFSCKKEATTVTVPAYLTEKLWTLDTLLVNLPSSYDDLTEEQKFNYTAALAFSKDKAQLIFKNDGAVNCSGDWDFGYTHWELLNGDKDISVQQAAIGYDTLRSWQATPTQLSYSHSIGSTAFDCTFIYK